MEQELKITIANSAKTKQFFMREKFDKIIKMAIRKIANLPALFYGISQKNASEYFGRGPQFNEIPDILAVFFDDSRDWQTKPSTG